MYSHPLYITRGLTVPTMTTANIEKATPGVVLRDSQVPGLHCRVGVKRKSFYLHYRTRGGRQRRPKIGDCSLVSIPDARKIAKDWLTEVAAGRDPVADWHQARGEMTAQELYEATWKEHWDKPRFRSSGYAKDVQYLWNKHLADEFGPRRLSEITAGAIRTWHAGYEDTPTVANRALELLSKMFTFAEDREWRGPGTSPCRRVSPFRENKRRRYASTDEIRAIGKILLRDLATEPESAAFLLLLMFTGSRPRAIERATLDQLQRVTIEGREFGVLTFAGKSTAETGENERVLLPPPALATLDAVSRKQDDNRLIGIKAPRRYWNKVRAEAGCPDLWMRDLRRTFATVGMSMGAGMDTIGELLNHKSTQTTKIYALLADEARVNAATGIADRVAELISGPRVEGHQRDTSAERAPSPSLPRVLES